MGLDTTHNCFHGSYTRFYEWRNALCVAAGIEYACGGRDRSAAELNGDWAKLPDDIIYVLIDHSDYDGHILAQHCAPLADRLEGLMPKLLRPDQESAKRFVKGLRAAHAKGVGVLFA